jgi:hypothetical protein
VTRNDDDDDDKVQQQTTKEGHFEISAHLVKDLDAEMHTKSGLENADVRIFGRLVARATTNFMTAPT